MAKNYKIISVDSVTQTMVVEFIDTDTGLDVSYNVAVPAVGVTVEQQIMSVWPTPPNLSAGVTAATALIGENLTVSPSLADAKKSQITALTNAAAVQDWQGYQSDALSPGNPPFTYESNLASQTAMIASVTDAIRVAPAWSADWDYVVGDSVLVSGTRLLCVAGGTSGSSAPSGPGWTDGSATWVAPWFTLFSCTDAGGTLALVPHSADEIAQAGADGKNFFGAIAIKLHTLIDAVNAATDAAGVAAVTWSFP